MARPNKLLQTRRDDVSQDGSSGSSMSHITYLLLMVMGLALGLRVWGLHFGLPYDLTYDEVHEIIRALKLGAGEYTWNSFGKGGLYYLLFIEYGLLYVVWWMMGRVADAREFALLYLQDPTAFYLAGRLTVALMGTMTCWVIFWIGRRVYNTWTGLGAAFIGATAYFDGEWSHYINVDIGMTLTLWASILSYLQYENNERFRWLVAAGIFGGIAIAFKLPGAIVVPILFAAITSRPGRWGAPYSILREVGWVLLVLLVTLTVVSPEWIMGVMEMNSPFARLVGQGDSAIDGVEGGKRGAVNIVTLYHGKQWFGYAWILLQDYNVVLTVSALFGLGWGLWHQHRWDIIWGGLLVVFLGVMMTADRSQSERYLVPIMPALWLLSSRAIMAVSGRRVWGAAIGFACVVAIPLATLVYQDYMWTQSDTRILAKTWIENHVPSGAKILMDGMRYRFVQSPPLNLDKTAVDRRITKASQAEHLSRGISQGSLALYAEAARQVKGPVYDLHSTVWGLEVEALPYYVQNCFDYIVTSSLNVEIYAREAIRQRFPKSARFYELLSTDPRFRVVYAAAPIPWQNRGPTITVYEVTSACDASQNATAPQK